MWDSKGEKTERKKVTGKTRRLGTRIQTALQRGRRRMDGLLLPLEYFVRWSSGGGGGGAVFWLPNHLVAVDPLGLACLEYVAHVCSGEC